MEWSECGRRFSLGTDPEIERDSDSENWKEVHKMVTLSGYGAIKPEGYTFWALGKVWLISQFHVENLSGIHPMSVMVKVTHDIENEVFWNLPCVLNAQGLTSVINQKLKADQVAQLKKSADTLWDV